MKLSLAALHLFTSLPLALLYTVATTGPASPDDDDDNNLFTTPFSMYDDNITFDNFTLDTNNDSSSTSNSSSSNSSSRYMGVMGMTDEQRLLQKLLQGYDRNTRPVYNASDAVIVRVGITLTQIFDLDEKNQVLTTNVWLDQAWNDEKLVWQPEDFNGLKILRVPCRLIWKPDIVLYNSVEDYTDGYMQALAMVSHDGSVFWPPIVKFQSTCQIDITYFPFDDQICKMKLGSWAYDGFQVDVNNRSVPVDLSNYVSNGEWLLISVTAKHNVVYYPCCPEPFPDVTFMIHLRRRTLYYTHNVIIPCVMLSCLTLLVFWMSPDSGEKVTLGLTVLLAFSVFMLLIAENMPATSSFVPLIGMYLTMVMGITSVSVMLAVLVSNISHRGRFEIPLPNWMRCLVVAMSRVMCVKLYYIRPTPSPGYTSTQTSSTARPRRNLYRMGNCTHLSNDSGCGLLDYELTEALSPENNNGNPSTEMHSPPASRRRGGRTKEDDIDVILRLLKKVLLKENEKDECEEMKLQWEEASRVLDRFLFYIFLVLTLAATIVTLFVLPLTKPERPSLVSYT